MRGKGNIVLESDTEYVHAIDSLNTWSGRWKRPCVAFTSGNHVMNVFEALRRRLLEDAQLERWVNSDKIVELFVLGTIK